MPEWRRCQGWSQPDFGNAEVVIAPDRTERRTLVARADSAKGVHLFSGINAYPETYWTLKQLATTEAVLCVMIEPGHHNDHAKVNLRRWYHKALAHRWRRRLNLVLATGALGCVWWRAAGFPAEKVIPFGYFVEPPDSAALPATSISKCESFRIIHVGQINRGKALDVLLRSLAGLNRRDWMLDIVGTGPKVIEYRRLSASLGVADRVRWFGNVSNIEVLRAMSEADLLVLPSRYDGWGAVVNEALSVGTPIIASDACGAADLLKAPWRGEVFPSEKIRALTDALQRRIAAGPISSEQRQRLRAWARKAISPASAARYLIDVLENVHEPHPSAIPPPWLCTGIDSVMVARW